MICSWGQGWKRLEKDYSGSFNNTRMHKSTCTYTRNNTTHPLTQCMFMYVYKTQTAMKEKSSHLLVQSTAATQLQSSFLTPKYRVLLQLWAGDRVCSVLDCWLTLEPVLFSTARQILFLRARPCNGSPFTHCPLQSSLPARNVSFRSKERWLLRMSACERKTQHVCVGARIWICREKVCIYISQKELPLLGLTQSTASPFFICCIDKLFLI